MRRTRTGLGTLAAVVGLIALTGGASAQGSARQDGREGGTVTVPRTPPGASQGTRRHPGSIGTGTGSASGSASGSESGSESGRSGGGSGGAGPVVRTTTGAGRAQPATTDPRLRDRLYNNVRHPGGTYSSQPLSPEQDLDRAPEASTEHGETFKILGSEDFDGFTAYAVNDADLLIEGLTEEQRRLVRVIYAGEFGNPYDLILVDDRVGVDVHVYAGGAWYGAGRPYAESGYVYPYVSGSRFYGWWGVYPLGYPSAHAARWGFPYGYGLYYPDWYWVSPNGYFYDGYRRYWGPIDSSYSPAYRSGQAGEAEAAEVEIELTAIELARALLSAGRLEEAIASYREHLRAFPEDSVAMRELGAALIERGQVGDGFAMIRMAYGIDPGLAGDPLDGRLFGSAARLREVVRKAVRAANKEETSSGWLAVAVLMQAEGRDRVALKNLAKAERQYLSEDIARAMRRSLD